MSVGREQHFWATKGPGAEPMPCRWKKPAPPHQGRACFTYNEPRQKEPYNCIAGVDLALPNACEQNVNYAIAPGLAMCRGNLTEEHEKQG